LVLGGRSVGLSNNDIATADYNNNLDRGIMEMHPATTLEECAKVRAMGEVAYHAAAFHKASQWIEAHPERFAALTAERAWLFWVPKMRRPAQTLIALLLPVLGAAGLLLLRHRRPDSFWLLAGVALSYQFTFLFVQSFARYSYPVQWVLWVGTGMILHAAHCRWGGAADQE
jgi:hypothetical protein